MGLLDILENIPKFLIFVFEAIIIWYVEGVVYEATFRMLGISSWIIILISIAGVYLLTLTIYGKFKQKFL